MLSNHYKLLVCGQPSFRAMHELLPQLAFAPGMERGFKLSDETTNVNRVRGRYLFTRQSKLVSIDPSTLDPKEETVESLVECRFELDQRKGLVGVEGRRGDLTPLFEALDAMPGVHVDFEELNINLTQYMFELQSAFKKNEVKALRIRDYLAREQMLTSASFKLLDKQDAEKLAEKFSDQLDAISLQLKLPDGACNITVTRKGSIRASDDAPDELLVFAKEILPRFHEAEVETTAAVDPVAARRKRKR